MWWIEGSANLFFFLKRLSIVFYRLFTRGICEIDSVSKTNFRNVPSGVSGYRKRSKMADPPAPCKWEWNSSFYLPSNHRNAFVFWNLGVACHTYYCYFSKLTWGHFLQWQWKMSQRSCNWLARWSIWFSICPDTIRAVPRLVFRRMAMVHLSKS